ncbi:hypothetical protein [uncultured Martelella sp.]|uniref:hypothetical protein n=1 Tax=uncultured Martelella sp. TaxID=392331 RepID=UPI0029C8E2E0|nr:hypothetical protein [uncultured Martelella sp.]
MSQEFTGSSSLLPPAMKFSAVTGIFSGTAEPGKTVRLTSSADQRVLSATADDTNGSWTIALGKVPRLYTQFDIQAWDPETKACSATVKYIYGGENPELADVYVGKTLAFGHSRPGTKVVIYGPTGRVLGQSFVFGKLGVWTVRLGDAVEAGDTVCVMAESLIGNTSMPFFTRVEAFSLEHRNVGHIAGFGARPNDNVQLFDVASGQELASTVASDAGAWSLSFQDPLEAGTRVVIQRTHIDGETSKGPIFTAIKNDCLAPVIETFSGNRLSGMAQPGLQVDYAQFRNGVTVHKGSVSVPQNGQWSSDDATYYQPFEFQSGDILVAKSTDANDTAESWIPSSVTIGSTRPGAPLVAYIDQTGAWGYAGPLKNVIISTEDAGLIWVARSNRIGYWSANWTPTAGVLATTTRVFFEVLDSWQLTNDIQTSTATVRYADAAASKPDAPVIDTYIPSEIAGTESTAGTVVVVHNADEDDQAINSGGTAVTNGAWQVNPTGSYVPNDGDEIFAVAWTLIAHGQLGVNSNRSRPVDINSYVPPKPNVSFGHPTDIEGNEPVLAADLSELPNIVIHVGYASAMPRKSIANSGHLTSGRDWSITPVPALTVGDQMVAWAETDAGEISGETPFTITAAVTAKPAPPMITKWDTANISGTGPGGTLVSLTKNGQDMGAIAVGPAQYGYSWQINIGTPALTGDVLQVVATDQGGHNSDPFYIYVDDVPTHLTVEAVTTSELTANVSTAYQRLLAWRSADGLKVIDHLIGGPGTYTVRYLPNVTVETGDLIMCSSMDTTYSSTEGSMVHYESKYVPYSA